MRRLALWGALAALAGCGGNAPTREDLSNLKAELEANSAKNAAQLKGELLGVDQKYVTVQQLQMKTEKQLIELTKLQEDLTILSAKLQSKVDLATSNVLKVLEFEERLLTDRLASLRSMIEDLKKP